MIAAKSPHNLIRLNRYLALATGLSRRAADVAITDGRVRVNGRLADLGTQTDHDDVITLDGQTVVLPEQFTYIAFHKPVGYITSRRQQGNTPTIYELLPPQYHRLKPVGRLDKDSSGLLVLTDDGEFANLLTHPSSEKQKIYQVLLDKDLSEQAEQAIAAGVQLDDGISHLELHKLRGPLRRAWVVTMTEGRNRQIRRTFAALGYTVKSLRRDVFGRLHLGGLQPGKLAQTTKESIV